MAVGSWQLAVGSWQLAVGSWQLAVGSWQLAVGSWQLKGSTTRGLASYVFIDFINTEIATSTLKVMRPAEQSKILELIRPTFPNRKPVVDFKTKATLTSSAGQTVNELAPSIRLLPNAAANRNGQVSSSNFDRLRLRSGCADRHRCGTLF